MVGEPIVATVILPARDTSGGHRWLAVVSAHRSVLSSAFWGNWDQI